MAEGPAGVDQMSALLDQFRAIGSAVGESYLAFMLAEEYIRNGRDEEAVEQLWLARKMMDDKQERFMEPDYYRLLGKISLRQYETTGDRSHLEAAEEHLNDALVNARHHESKGLELRAALDLADALCLQGKNEAAQRLLAGINQRIEEPDTSADFVRIRDMLKKLSTEVR